MRPSSTSKVVYRCEHIPEHGVASPGGKKLCRFSLNSLLGLNNFGPLVLDSELAMARNIEAALEAERIEIQRVVPWLPKVFQSILARIYLKKEALNLLLSIANRLFGSCMKQVSRLFWGVIPSMFPGRFIHFMVFPLCVRLSCLARQGFSRWK